MQDLGLRNSSDWADSLLVGYGWAAVAGRLAPHRGAAPAQDILNLSGLCAPLSEQLSFPKVASTFKDAGGTSAHQLLVEIAKAEREAFRDPEAAVDRLNVRNAQLSAMIAAATSRRRSRWRTAGRVVAAAGTVAVIGALVATVTIVFKERQIRVPDAVGADVAQAKQKLSEQGWTVSVAYRHSDRRPADVVISQVPAPGSGLSKDGAVALVVSDGPAPVAVPDVTGLDVWDARYKLREAGLEPSSVASDGDDSVDGRVVGTEPGPGQKVQPGSQVLVVYDAG